MNIVAIIPPGRAEITVNGLHQWDYGRQLEIHSDALPAIVEVHFACAGMDEAVVRSCSAVNGVATAAIPDRCLEQTTPIIAWVYEISGTTGATTAKIMLPVEPRTRPSAGESIPEDVSDQYTEAVAAMNEVKQWVDDLMSGDVTVAKATNADHATEADHAKNATSATNAQIAVSAHLANQATGALQLMNMPEHSFDESHKCQIRSPGIYVVLGEIQLDTGLITTAFTICIPAGMELNKTVMSSSFVYESEHYNVWFLRTNETSGSIGYIFCGNTLFTLKGVKAYRIALFE